MNINAIVELSSAFYGSSILFALVELDICTHIAQEAAPTLEALAARTGYNARGLRLLLDAAVAIRLLTKQNETYGLTEGAAATLVHGAPHDLTRAILYNRDVVSAWSKLSTLVQTGAPVEAPTLHLGDDAERTRRFAYAMHGRAMGIGKAVVPALPLPPKGRILDLAGGPGTYALLMAQHAPGITIDTWDLPAISAVAQEITAPCKDRITCHAGDYHTDHYPAESYDLVTLFGCLHQESPEAIIDILRRAKAALKPKGAILILDLMTEADHTAPAFAALFAVNMALTTTHGWVFSKDELTQYALAAGLQAPTFTPVPPPMPHLLATLRNA